MRINSCSWIRFMPLRWSWKRSNSRTHALRIWIWWHEYDANDHGLPRFRCDNANGHAFARFHAFPRFAFTFGMSAMHSDPELDEIFSSIQPANEFIRTNFDANQNYNENENSVERIESFQSNYMKINMKNFSKFFAFRKNFPKKFAGKIIDLLAGRLSTYPPPGKQSERRICW